MKVDNISYIVDACVEFCFLKKQFLNLTINMQLLYFITTVTSQVHSASHRQHAGYSALPSIYSCFKYSISFFWSFYSLVLVLITKMCIGQENIVLVLVLLPKTCC